MCKRVICLGLVALLGLAHVACAGGLVGWWKLDETTGTTVGDSSGNGITGNFVGAPKWVPGKLGGALELDGKSWVDFGNPPKTLITGTTPVAIALWINPSNLGATLAGTGADRAFVARNQNYAFKASGPYARFTTPGVLDHNATNTILKINEWQHVAVTFQPSTTGGCVFYLNGVQTDRLNASAYNAAAATAGAVTGVGGPFFIGNNQWATSNQQYFGLYDDIQLYDRLLTGDHIKEIYAGSRATFFKAENPNPADKAIGVSQALFQWTPGDGAVLHNVYLGTTPELTEANLAGVKLPFTMYFHVAGLQPGAVHYWRVDEVDAAGKVTTGDVWSFTATPATAWTPKPVDGATFMPAALTLEWLAGMNAVSHDVYLSMDRAAVAAGAPETRKAEKQPATTYAAAALERGKAYYWRVDEILADGTKVAGPIWSFSVRPVLAKTDPNMVGYWKLDDEKSPFVVDYSGYDNYGTPQGTQWVEGTLGDALQFSGAQWVDLPPGLVQSKLGSVACWVKTTQTSVGTIFYSNAVTTGDGYGGENELQLNVDTGQARFYIEGGSADVSVRSGTINTGEWQHVAAVWDATAAVVYVNGVKAAQANNTGNAFTAAGMTRMGRPAASSRYYNGLLDDARLYNKALSPDEIRQAMRGDPLIAWNPQPKSTVNLDIRDATTLTWSAGDGAAKHDVYFGKDKNAVKIATPTSPECKGRQTGTSFSLAGLVEFGGGSYYWRIDEVEADGTTIHKGVVWSFTIPGYLIVDEFESYTDDDGNRIYQTWIDGMGPDPKIPGNGSGSVVGNDPAPFAERTVVHGGRQSLPMLYDNTKLPYYSEADRTFAPLQNWKVGDVSTLSLWFRGRPATPAVTETVLGQYKVGACSNDIWGTADSFFFYYKTLNGDGSISAKVVSITNTTTNWAKAGVMIRETLNPDSTYALMFPTPDRRRAFQNRPTTGGNAVSAHSAVGAFTALPFWVKVERKSSTITGYYSTDGKTWTRQPDTENTGTDKSLNPQLINMSASICLGLAVASNNFGASTCFGEFAEVTTTGSVTGQWQLAKVGTSYSNDPDKLYVVVEDSTKNRAVLTHPDPAAVGLTTWTQWKIPLNDLVGVNLAKVQKMSIGVGDRANAKPVPAGTGKMFIDDIQVTK